MKRSLLNNNITNSKCSKNKLKKLITSDIKKTTVPLLLCVTFIISMLPYLIRWVGTYPNEILTRQ